MNTFIYANELDDLCDTIFYSKGKISLAYVFTEM